MERSSVRFSYQLLQPSTEKYGSGRERICNINDWNEKRGRLTRAKGEGNGAALKRSRLFFAPASLRIAPTDLLEGPAAAAQLLQPVVAYRSRPRRARGPHSSLW